MFGVGPYESVADTDLEGSPMNPTESKGRDAVLGDVQGLLGAVHASHSHTDNPRRQKTYLIATYTGVLEEADIRQRWFVPRVGSPYQSAAAVGARVAQQIVELADSGGGYQNSSVAGTSPHTDASVSIRLIGSVADSGEQRLVHEGDDAEIFRPGHVDEFAITCTDIGDIEAIEVWHGNDGLDWNTSRWKLEKLIVTCLQSSLTRGHRSPGGKGDYAETTSKTTDSAQWHFVPREHWLGCTPASTSDLELKIRLAREERDTLEAKLMLLGDQIRRYEVELSDKRKAPTTSSCPHAYTRIAISTTPAGTPKPLSRSTMHVERPSAQASARPAPAQLPGVDPQRGEWRAECRVLYQVSPPRPPTPPACSHHSRQDTR
jgi:hypothetical protein